MPHVIVKLWPGASEQQKRRLAKQILEDVVATLQSGRASWTLIALDILLTRIRRA